jgi:glycerol kinase
MNYIAAIDQGTTSTRCILFDHGGNIVSVAQKEHRQIYPRPGWVEHDPLRSWRTHRKSWLSSPGIGDPKSHTIGISNQRETTVVWDRRTGQPVCNAIVWQDTRTDAICAELAKEDGQDRFRVRTGLPVATYFSGPKVKWMLDNVPGARERAEAGELLFGTIDSWLIWNLTGVHVTDVTNASRTLLMDVVTLSWDQEILSLLGIPGAMLPEIRSSAEIYGQVGTPGRMQTIVPAGGIPIAGDLGDQQAALFGQTCFSPGEAKNTYGTGCFMLLNTGRIHPVELDCSPSHKIGSRPAVMPLRSIAVTGAPVQWLRQPGLTEKSADVKCRGTVDDNGGVYLCRPSRACLPPTGARMRVESLPG